MSNSKNIKEFLANGGKIEKLPPAERNDRHVCQNTTYRPPQILSLDEADELYGKSRNRGSLDSEEDIVNALAKIVERDPTFIERKNIPEKYVKQLPKHLQDAGTIKIRNDINRIDTDKLPPGLMDIFNQQAAKGSDSDKKE